MLKLSMYSRIILCGFLCSILILILNGCGQHESISDDNRKALATEITQELDNLLDVWYPRVIDSEHGGYLSRFTYDWKLEGSQDKMIVTQARHLWTLSKIGGKYPEDNRYAEFAAQGFDFLRNHMWDDVHGGFYQFVSREGEAIAGQSGTISKTLYGNAFAIYGLAAYYGFSNDTDALDLAKQAFAWVDTHAHDSVYGGYFQPLARDGTPDTTGYPKDYNSGIHILEALTELYSVWPDEVVRDRLEEMFYIVRDTMTTDRGYLNLYFRPDWTHLSYRDSSEAVIMENISSDHVTPGHDIETSYLLLEAAHVLGLEDDRRTIDITKQMTDHTLESGWDEEAGGFYDIGYYFEGDTSLTILRDTKNWWAQAEGLNTLLIMANLYPDDPYDYFEKFVRQWEYIKSNLIDPEHKGWYDSGLDKKPESRTALKSQIWKGNYHTVRSLMGCLERLENRN